MDSNVILGKICQVHGKRNQMITSMVTITVEIQMVMWEDHGATLLVMKNGNIVISMTHFTYQSVLSCSSINFLILCFLNSKYFPSILSRNMKDDLISFVNSYFSLKLKTLETIVMGIFSGFLHL